MKFECNKLTDLAELRFEFFKSKVFSKLLHSVQGQVLIYIPSYLDYVRVRNFFKQQAEETELPYGLCCEYTPNSSLSRARSKFQDGRYKFLLYSERLHYNRRLNIKGAKNIIFYAPPTYPNFYSEIINSLTNEGAAYCLLIYSMYDIYQLERIVGSKRAQTMTESEKSTHLLC